VCGRARAEAAHDLHRGGEQQVTNASPMSPRVKSPVIAGTTSIAATMSSRMPWSTKAGHRPARAATRCVRSPEARDVTSVAYAGELRSPRSKRPAPREQEHTERDREHRNERPRAGFASTPRAAAAGRLAPLPSRAAPAP